MVLLQFLTPLLKIVQLLPVNPGQNSLQIDRSVLAFEGIVPLDQRTVAVGIAICDTSHARVCATFFRVFMA